MALKTFNPTTPSQRQLVIVDRSSLYKGKPVKSLTEGLTSRVAVTTPAASPSVSRAVVTSAAIVWSTSSVASSTSKQPSSVSNTTRTVPLTSLW